MDGHQWGDMHHKGVSYFKFSKIHLSKRLGQIQLANCVHQPIKCIQNPPQPIKCIKNPPQEEVEILLSANLSK